MSGLPNSRTVRRLIAPCLCLLCFCVNNCSIIDLRKLTISTFPKETGYVLLQGEEISCTFSRPVLETETESIISIVSEGGSVNIDFVWEENTVILQPAEHLIPATRYYLVIDGRVPLGNGAFQEADILIPFYFRSGDPQMNLIAIQPGEGETAGTTTPLTFTFSREPDISSFTLHFSLSPDTRFTLNKMGNTVCLTPDGSWDPCTIYEWTIPPAVSSVEGIPLCGTEKGLFVVQEDSSPPLVLTCFPTEYTGTDPLPLSDDLNDIGYSSEIVLCFSEPVEEASVNEAFSLDPKPEGHLIRHSDSLFVFSPSTGWDFQTEYTLTVSTAVKDTSGNPSVSPFILNFTPETIQDISVTSVEGVGEAAALFLLDTLSPQVIDVDELDNNSYTFTFYFSQSYPSEFHTAIEDAVTLEFIHPGGLNPEPRTVLWGPSNTSLTIIYEHITWLPPMPGFTNLYRLTLASGEGTGNGTGGYIREEVIIILECGS